MMDHHNFGSKPSKWRWGRVLLWKIPDKKSNLCLFLCPLVKFDKDRMIHGRVIAYFRFSKWRPSAILDVIFSHCLSKIQICAYFYVHVQNLGKIRWSAVELLHIFDFRNGGRPPSWIWYDVIWDHSWLVFDGPNILLKLHDDRIYTLQDIAISIFGRFGLNLPIHAPLGSFWKILSPSEFWYCRNPQKDCPWAKTRRMSHQLWKSVHGFACPRKNTV